MICVIWFGKVLLIRCCCVQSLPTEAEELVDRLPTDQEAAPLPEVVRTKTFYLQPMALEEALVQARPASCLQVFQAAEAKKREGWSSGCGLQLTVHVAGSRGLLVYECRHVDDYQRMSVMPDSMCLVACTGGASRP